MAAKSQTLQSARDKFPKSANKTVLIRSAWHPERSTTGAGSPEKGGMDGWEAMAVEATRAQVDRLEGKGFTWVSLENSGATNTSLDVPIASLYY